MRLTPAQCGLHRLIGDHFPFWGPEPPLADRIREGRAFLARISDVDLGYDPQAWHQHLRTTNVGEYHWSNKHLGFPRQIATTLASLEWHAAVASLRAAQNSEPVGAACGAVLRL